MNALWPWLLTALAVLCAAWAWARRRPPPAPARRKPRATPPVAVQPRVMLGRGELRVWRWLQDVFPEHHVMVKLPVTRFCKPRDRSAAEGLFNMLSGVYCTFTLADDTGRAIGCVDVMDLRRLSRGNRQLKQNLLAQCHIGYWLLTPDVLPEAWAIRAEFLGLGATESSAAPLTDSAELQAARHNLVETLDRRRSDRRSSQMAPLDINSGISRFTDWGQLDSFPIPLEERGEHAPSRR